MICWFNFRLQLPFFLFTFGFTHSWGSDHPVSVGPVANPDEYDFENADEAEINVSEDEEELEPQNEAELLGSESKSCLFSPNSSF